MYPTREEAWEIFTEYNKDEHLIKHGLTVEAVSYTHLLWQKVEVQSGREYK